MPTNLSFAMLQEDVRLDFSIQSLILRYYYYSKALSEKKRVIDVHTVCNRTLNSRIWLDLLAASFVVPTFDYNALLTFLDILVGIILSIH